MIQTAQVTSSDVVGNTTLPANETAATQNPEIVTLSTITAEDTNQTQTTITESQGNTTSGDLGGSTKIPLNSNVTVGTTLDTEISVVNVTATEGKNLTSPPNPEPSSASPLTTESALGAINSTVPITEAPGSSKSTLSVTTIGGEVVQTTGLNKTNRTTTTTSTTTTTTTPTEEPKIPTTSNPHVSSANSSAIRLEERADLGSYGYTSEVVLICFCVMFGLLFLGMVGKYYQLKKNIGDYRLQQVI